MHVKDLGQQPDDWQPGQQQVHLINLINWQLFDKKQVQVINLID